MMQAEEARRIFIESNIDDAITRAAKNRRNYCLIEPGDFPGGLDYTVETRNDGTTKISW